MTTPEAAAEAIVEGIKRDKLYVYVGRDARVMNLLYRLAPRRAIHLVYNQMKSLFEVI